MTDQPKPATDEWTDYEARWLCERGWQVVKDRHNAALAAEREGWQLATEDCHRIISRKNEELAALRDENKTFRAAQKACEDCDGPTMAEVQTLQNAMTKLRHLNEVGLANTAEAREIILAALMKVK